MLAEKMYYKTIENLGEIRNKMDILNEQDGITLKKIQKIREAKEKAKEIQDMIENAYIEYNSKSNIFNSIYFYAFIGVAFCGIKFGDFLLKIKTGKNK